jgi:hypothetical protein
MKPKMKSKMDQKWIKNGSKRPTVNDPNAGCHGWPHNWHYYLILLVATN